MRETENIMSLAANISRITVHVSQTALPILFSLTLASCSVLGLSGRSEDEGFFLPPSTDAPAPALQPGETLAATATILPISATDQAALPTSTTLSCNDNLTFLADLTLPDGSVVSPNASLDKQWQVENSGTCNWDERYRIKLVSGPDLSGRSEQELFPARSGTQAIIRVQFTTPADPGAYRSAWQAHSPQGVPFGDPFFIDILVQEDT
jgi:hypothetical protein